MCVQWYNSLHPPGVQVTLDGICAPIAVYSSRVKQCPWSATRWIAPTCYPWSRFALARRSCTTLKIMLRERYASPPENLITGLICPPSQNSSGAGGGSWVKMGWSAAAGSVRRGRVVSPAWGFLPMVRSRQAGETGSTPGGVGCTA